MKVVRNLVDILYSREKKIKCNDKNGILLPKLFWPTMRKNCCRDRENILKELKAENLQTF